MTSSTQVPRIVRLREWMDDHEITDVSLGLHLGLSRGSVCRILNSQTMRTEHYDKCLALGFPPELLPLPFDRKTGPRPKQPRFPGLVAAQ